MIGIAPDDKRATSSMRARSVGDTVAGMRLTVSVLLAATAAALLTPTAHTQGQTKAPGYTDTPKLPDSQWRVHDSARPHPPIVTPGSAPSADRPGKPPSDAIVLFNGTDLSQWTGRDGKAQWKIEGGAMVVNGTGEIRTRREFGSCQLHLEWATPAVVKGDSQGRGNSGVFLMKRYEVQILDSHDNVTYADGQAASLYGQTPPLVNASRPAGAWQTYDIVFMAPVFDGDKVVSPARVTVFHNGVLAHHDKTLIGSTTHKRVGAYAPHPDAAPLALQDHGNPTRFRNIWIRPLHNDGR